MESTMIAVGTGRTRIWIIASPRKWFDLLNDAVRGMKLVLGVKSDVSNQTRYVPLLRSIATADSTPGRVRVTVAFGIPVENDADQ